MLFLQQLLNKWPGVTFFFRIWYFYYEEMEAWKGALVQCYFIGTMVKIFDDSKICLKTCKLGESQEKELWKG